MEPDFETWTREHGPVLLRVARRLSGRFHDAEDLVQDTFRSAWKGRHLYDPRRNERSWLISILRRRAADMWRRRKDEPFIESPHMLESPASTDFSFHELPREMEEALDSLPRGIRNALVLVVVDELTHQEASQKLGVPIGTVLSRVSRGRSRMREMLLEKTSP